MMEYLRAVISFLWGKAVQRVMGWVVLTRPWQKCTLQRWQKLLLQVMESGEPGVLEADEWGFARFYPRAGAGNCVSIRPPDHCPWFKPAVPRRWSPQLRRDNSHFAPWAASAVIDYVVSRPAAEGSGFDDGAAPETHAEQNGDESKSGDQGPASAG